MSEKKLTVTMAKTNVLAEERRLVSAIPSEYVASHKQLSESYLLSCVAGGYTWPDKGTVRLTGEPDIHRVLQAVADLYEKDSHFTVQWGHTMDGAQKLTITAESGASYIVAPRQNDSELQIAAFSDCFELPDDEWAGGKY